MKRIRMVCSGCGHAGFHLGSPTGRCDFQPMQHDKVPRQCGRWLEHSVLAQKQHRMLRVCEGCQRLKTRKFMKGKLLYYACNGPDTILNRTNAHNFMFCGEYEEHWVPDDCDRYMETVVIGQPP